MEANLVRMPFGRYLGAVALSLTVDEDDEKVAEGLGVLLSQILHPGIGCIYLKSVPWKATWWPEALWEAQEHEAVAQFGRSWVGVHQLDEPAWVAGPIHWTMDASYLLCEQEMTEETLARALEIVPAFPRVDDLILREPMRSNLNPGVLDAIHYFVRALNPAQIVLPAASIDAAVIAAVARCESSWVLVAS